MRDVCILSRELLSQVLCGMLTVVSCLGLKPVHTVCVVSGNELNPASFFSTFFFIHTSKKKLADTFVLNDLQVRQNRIQTPSSQRS